MWGQGTVTLYNFYPMMQFDTVTHRGEHHRHTNLVFFSISISDIKKCRFVRLTGCNALNSIITDFYKYNSHYVLGNL